MNFKHIYLMILFGFSACSLGHRTKTLCPEEDIFCQVNKFDEPRRVPRFRNRRDEMSHKRMPMESDVRVRTACDSSQKVFYHLPSAAFIKKTWEELAAFQDYLVTPIVTERCKNLGKPCSNLIGFLRGNLKTECVQKYIKVKVKTVARNTTHIVRVPSACVCSVSSYYFPNYRSLENYKYKFF